MFFFLVLCLFLLLTDLSRVISENHLIYPCPNALWLWPWPPKVVCTDSWESWESALSPFSEFLSPWLYIVFLSHSILFLMREMIFLKRKFLLGSHLYIMFQRFSACRAADYSEINSSQGFFFPTLNGSDHKSSRLHWNILFKLYRKVYICCFMDPFANYIRDWAYSLEIWNNSVIFDQDRGQQAIK